MTASNDSYWFLICGTIIIEEEEIYVNISKLQTGRNWKRQAGIF